MKKSIIFIDLDGTLITTVSGETFPKGIWDMKFNMKVLHYLKTLKPSFIGICTNQGGIEAGFVKRDAFEAKLSYVAHAIEDFTGVKTYTQYCASTNPSHPYRKPNPCMLNDLESLITFDHTKDDCIMIGDRPEDAQAAKAFGIDFLNVTNIEHLTL